jgi:hypothetical protein
MRKIKIRSNLAKGTVTLKETTQYGTTFSVDMVMPGVNGNTANVRVCK